MNLITQLVLTGLLLIETVLTLWVGFTVGKCKGEQEALRKYSIQLQGDLDKDK